MNRFRKILCPISKALRITKKRVFWIVNYKRYAKQSTSLRLQFPIFQYATPIKKKYLPTHIQYDQSSIHNIALASSSLNGLILEPGQIFSFWKAIGVPTMMNGYKKGIGLHNKQFQLIVGGGINQLANVVYWMALHSPLTVIERHRHSYDLFPDVDRKIPFGTGASCIYNVQDLQIKNNTNLRYQLLIDCDEEQIVARIVTDDPPKYKYEVYEKTHKIKQTSAGEYIRNNVIHRKMVTIDHKEIFDEFIMENNATIVYRPIIPCLIRSLDENMDTSLPLSIMT